MAEPALDQRTVSLQASEPQVAPALSDDHGIRRPRVVGEHRRRPVEHRLEHAASAPVDVVRVAVVRRGDRDHGLQRGRLPRRDLERVEAAPGDAEHADRAGAPRLRGKPLDHLHCVELLLRQVLVKQQAVRVAAAAHVHTNRRVTVAGEVRVADGVAGGRLVVLAVRKVLEQRRHRRVLGVLRQPDPRRKSHTVGQRDPHVPQLAHAPRKIPRYTHGPSLIDTTALARRADRCAPAADSWPCSCGRLPPWCAASCVHHFEIRRSGPSRMRVPWRTSRPVGRRGAGAEWLPTR